MPLIVNQPIEVINSEDQRLIKVICVDGSEVLAKCILQCAQLKMLKLGKTA